ncbi:unnamed protein product [Sphagnum compactum]
MCEETGRRERDKVNVKSTYTTVDEQTDDRKTVTPAWRNRKKKDDMVLEEEHKTSNVTFMGEVLDVEESSGQVRRGHDLADDEVELHTDNGKVERHGQCEESESDLKEMIMQQREKGLILITVRKEKPQLYQPVVKLEKKQREMCDEPQLCSNQKTNITNFHAKSLQTSPSKACASVPSNVNPEYLQDGKKITGGTLISEAAQTPVQFSVQRMQQPTVTHPDLQKETEDLKDQVAEERRKRHLVTQRLAQQRTEADKIAQQKQEHWDTKYRELQKEKYAMSIRLQSLETAHLASLLAGRGTSLRFGRAPASIPPQRCLPPTIQTKPEIDHEAAKLKWSMMKRQVTEQEVKKLRREIEEQEILIRGYQHENEKALQKLKEAQAEAREQSRIMTEENAMLAAQLAKLQNFAKSKKKVSEGESEKRAIEAELEKRVLEVKAEKQELEMQVSQVEAAKSVLEAEVMKRVGNLELELTALREELEEEQRGHARTAASREGKIRKLVETQELLASGQSTIAEQAAHILELSSKLSNCLVAATSEKHVDDWCTPFQRQQGLFNSDSTCQTESPQKQGKRPEPAPKVAKKDLGGLCALAQVPKLGSEESIRVQRLQSEPVALQRQIAQKDEEYNKKCTVVKQELDKLKSDYAACTQSCKQLRLQAQSGNVPSESEQSAVNRIKDLEKQVVNMRIHYVRKVKDLNDKLEESKRDQSKFKLSSENATSTRKPCTLQSVKRLCLEQPQHTSQPSSKEFSLIRELQAAKDRVLVLEEILNEKDLMIGELHNQIKEINSAANDRFGDIMFPAAALTNAKSQKLKHLNSLTIHAQESRDGSADASGSDVIMLRKQLVASEMGREMLQQQCTEALEKAAMLSLSHQQVLQHLQQVSHITTDIQDRLMERKGATEGCDWKISTHSLDSQNQALEARLKRRMTQEFEGGASSGWKSPENKHLACCAIGATQQPPGTTHGWCSKDLVPQQA